MSVAVVVPSCRPDSLRTFLDAWTPQFKEHNVKLIVVRDEPETWEKLPSFIPNKSGSIRSLGLLQAYREGYDIISLDDDVLPAQDVDLFGEYQAAFDAKWPVSDYFDIGHTFGLDEYMRGFPFTERDAASPLLQYGGWDNVPDLDAVTQRSYEERGRQVDGHHFDRRCLSIPRGVGFTGCIMNVACRHDAIPLLYQLIMGTERVGYDRWDDIWSGLIAKRICDHLDLPILVNGRASVVHTRASNTQRNYELEGGGYGLNERMWRQIRCCLLLSATTPAACYRELLDQLRPDWFGDCGQRIINGIDCWLKAVEAA